MNGKNMKHAALLLAALLVTALAGCGTGNKEGGAVGDVAKVGDTACVQCHSAAKDPITGEGIIDQYNKSAHALSPSLSGAGCEGCHGGGAQHNGVGPIPYPKPDAARCATCHTGTNSTVLQAGLAMEGADVDPTNPSNHANGGYEGIVTSEKCYRCHSGEGAVLSNIAGYTGDKTIIENTAYMLIQDRDFSKFGGITCTTCHQHGGALRQINTRDIDGNVVAWDPNSNRKVDQFDLCTSCHTYQNPDGTLVASGTPASGTKPATAPFYHNTAWYRSIPSTHWDNPATGVVPSGVTALPSTLIEGYVVKTKGADPCFDCHGHEAKTNTREGRPATTYTDWAKSAHAGGLLDNKYAAAAANPVTASRTTEPVLYAQQGQAQFDAVMAAGVDGTSGPAWEHYNWDQSTGTGNRVACQRCHTSTGAANFMNNPAGYVAANNNFSHLSGWTAATGSPQNELLYCWGCHSNAGNGALRTPGAITETYTAGTTGDPATIVTYPDVAGSNVCMSCHLGREIGEVIKNDQHATGVRDFINSHYLAAGGTLFGTTGYEYAGLSYDNPSFFKHDKIGSTAAAGTGTNGPCVGCHMTSPNKHQFTNVTREAGTITAITSTACVTCHTGEFALTAQKLADEEHEYIAALEAAKAALAGKGMYFSNNSPYFFTAPYVVGGTNTKFTNWAGVYGFAGWKDTMGAAFNTNLLVHDPGGYAHNRIYVKRLIWDAVDFIYDGVINSDVNATIDAQVTAGRLSAADAAAAKTYLGTARP